MGRKSWLFANTARGAECSANLYSICQTAIENKLKPFEYLNYILDEMRKMDNIEDNPEQLRRLLPYSKELPQNIRQ